MNFKSFSGQISSPKTYTHSKTSAQGHLVVEMNLCGFEEKFYSLSDCNLKWIYSDFMHNQYFNSTYKGSKQYSYLDFMEWNG